MQRHRSLYLMPLIVGWLALILGGCAVLAEAPGPNNAVTFVVLLSTLVLACLITAVVMVVAERWPR